MPPRRVRKLKNRRKRMSDTNAVIAIYDSHSAADNAVKELQKSGFDMKKLSVVGKDYQTDEQVVGSITPATG
jgi:Heat induced stress protein YflT domain